MNGSPGAITLLVSLAILLSGCSSRTTGVRPESEPASSSPSSRLEQGDTAGLGAGVTASKNGATPIDENNTFDKDGYIDSLVQETISGFIQPDMSEYEKAKAAFDYMIESITLMDPLGLDLWKIRGNYVSPPSYVENRSLSVLLFRIGMCEDYAAALTTLLLGMGIEAEYVPGLTYSAQGELVDHAWTIAKIDGNRYHLDCQLEQNISRHGSIRYKYFMRGDATMRQSHRWGENLIDSGLLTSAQNDEIARDYLFEACPEDYPTPQRRTFIKAEPPEADVIRASITEEFKKYEQQYGELAPVESNIIPPVFALDGYGSRD